MGALSKLPSTDVFKLCPICVPEGGVPELMPPPPAHRHRAPPPPSSRVDGPTPDSSDAITALSTSPAGYVEPQLAADATAADPVLHHARASAPTSAANLDSTAITNIILLLIILVGVIRHARDHYLWILDRPLRWLELMRGHASADNSLDQQEKNLSENEAQRPARRLTGAGSRKRKDRRGGRPQPAMLQMADTEQLGRLMGPDEDVSEPPPESSQHSDATRPMAALLAPALTQEQADALFTPPARMVAPAAPATVPAGSNRSWLGLRVRVHGLKGAPQHNGREGVVMSEARGDPSAIRWNVSCSDGERLCLKETNLLRLENEGVPDATLLLPPARKNDDARSD